MSYQSGSNWWQVRYDRSSNGQERDNRSQREKGLKGLGAHRKGQSLGAEQLRVGTLSARV